MTKQAKVSTLLKPIVRAFSFPRLCATDTQFLVTAMSMGVDFAPQLVRPYMQLVMAWLNLSTVGTVAMANIFIVTIVPTKPPMRIYQLWQIHQKRHAGKTTSNHWICRLNGALHWPHLHYEIIKQCLRNPQVKLPVAKAIRRAGNIQKNYGCSKHNSPQHNSYSTSDHTSSQSVSAELRPINLAFLQLWHLYIQRCGKINLQKRDDLV